jgi:hypothetical protein
MSVVELKMCVVNGDMTSDSTSDNYPTIPLCSDCIAADLARREDSNIVSIGELVSDPEAECEYCGACTAA